MRAGVPVCPAATSADGPAILSFVVPAFLPLQNRWRAPGKLLASRPRMAPQMEGRAAGGEGTSPLSRAAETGCSKCRFSPRGCSEFLHVAPLPAAREAGEGGEAPLADAVLAGRAAGEEGAPLVGSKKAGCSKCRFSKRGCAKCLGRAVAPGPAPACGAVAPRRTRARSVRVRSAPLQVPLPLPLPQPPSLRLPLPLPVRVTEAPGIARPCAPLTPPLTAAEGPTLAPPPPPQQQQQQPQQQAPPAWSLPSVAAIASVFTRLIAPGSGGDARGGSAPLPAVAAEAPAPPAPIAPSASAPPASAPPAASVLVSRPLTFVSRRPSPAPRQPGRPPAYASVADVECGQLGADYEIKNVPECGRGLFAVRKFAGGALVARYGGTLRHVRCLPEDLPRTHLLRIPDSDNLIDGRPLADGLQVSGCGRVWLPQDAADAGKGYASIANSAEGGRGANARMVFLVDDAGVRPPEYDAHEGKRLCQGLAGILPRAAYLVALRDIEAGEEIRWAYQVSYA